MAELLADWPSDREGPRSIPGEVRDFTCNKGFSWRSVCAVY